MDRETLGILGGGVAGLAAAVAAHRAGLRPLVLERSPDPTPAPGPLLLWSGATAALEALGVGVVGPSPRRCLIEDDQGRPLHPLELGALGERAGSPVRVVERPALHAALRAALPTGALELGAELLELEPGPEAVTLTLRDRSLSLPLLIGADGAGSQLRRRLHGPSPARSLGLRVFTGLASGPPPALRRGDFLVRQGAEGAALLMPAQPGRVWWQLTVDEGLRDRLAVSRALGAWAPPLPRLLRSTPSHRIRSVVLEDRSPLTAWGQGRLSLIGDAAHPCAPTLGQGAGLALEDAAALSRALKEEGPTPAALRAYEGERARWSAAVVKASRAASVSLLHGGPRARLARSLGLALGGPLVSGVLQRAASMARR